MIEVRVGNPFIDLKAAEVFGAIFQYPGVNGAFHAATYLRILESVEPIRRHELIDGLEYFLDLALG